MADNESNPAFLIIGLIGTLVLIFFVGNIWAYVSLHARVIREQSALLAKRKKRLLPEMNAKQKLDLEALRL